MADTTETLILDVQIDQSDAQKQLVQTEQTMNRLKKEAADLRKEYNAGKISEEQYAEASLRIQKAQKTEAEQKRTLTKLVDTESNSRNALKARVSQLTKEYDNLNRNTKTGAERANQLEKELKELNAEITKTSKGAGLFKDQIGNYPEAMEQATKATVPFGQSLAKATDEVQPFGVSVGGATSSLIKFATPATAAIGVLAALGTAYASSSTGAKDLAFAQDRLTNITGGMIEAFGTLVGGGSGEGGTGILNKLIDGFGEYLSLLPLVQGYQYLFEKATGVTIESINEESKAAALAAEQLRKLGIEAARVAGFAKLFEKAAEDARRVRDDEANALQDRLDATNTVEQNLAANQRIRIDILNKEIEAIKKSTVNWQNKDEVVLQVEQKSAEIRDIEEEVNGKLTENITARRQILKLIKEEGELEAGVAAANRRLANTGLRGQGSGFRGAGQDNRSTSQSVIDAASTADFESDAFDVQQTQENITNAMADEFQLRLNMNEKFNADLIRFNKEAYKQDVENKKQAALLKSEIDQAESDAALMLAANITGSLAGLYKEDSIGHQILASANAVINTYLAATAALASGSEISPFVGIAAAAAAVANGLASVAQINGVQFAEGGWTGPGQKYDAVGIVHADEYVVPKHINNSAAAKPHIQALETMRVRGFADGGFTTNESISATQQALIMANAIKNMPPAIVSVSEINRVQDRIAVREKLSTL